MKAVNPRGFGGQSPPIFQGYKVLMSNILQICSAVYWMVLLEVLELCPTNNLLSVSIYTDYQKQHTHALREKNHLKEHPFCHNGLYYQTQHLLGCS